MSEEKSTLTLQDRLHAAIASALAESEPEEASLLSRWVVCIEQVQARGSSCSYIASESMSSWEIIGMVEAASEMARAHLTISVDWDEDDDDDDDEQSTS